MRRLPKEWVVCETPDLALMKNSILGLLRIDIQYMNCKIIDRL